VFHLEEGPEDPTAQETVVRMTRGAVGSLAHRCTLPLPTHGVWTLPGSNFLL